jgi:hypothetical protein
MLLHHSDNNGDDEWKFPYMPNYPCNYTSEFGKLVNVDESDRKGMVVRERFVRGEVATATSVVTNGVGGGVNGDRDGGEEESLECKIGLKFRQLGISSKMMLETKKKEVEEDAVNEVLLLGKILFDKLGSRIQLILERSCHNVVDDSGAMGNSSADGGGGEVTMINMASRIVAAFESYLVSLALDSSNKDNNDNDDDCMMGYPPLQSSGVYDIFNEILVSPPRIIIRDKKSGYHHNNRRHDGSVSGSELSTDMNKFGVLIPTIHFYFPAEDDNSSSSSSRKSAFHRILLYAVSQFHGLETSSSVIAPDKKKSGNKKKQKQKDHRGNDATKRRGGNQQRQQNDAKGSIKVVTVQGGVLLAPSVKLLDCIIK